MTCAHCFREDAQDMDLQLQDIDNVLDQTIIINTLELCGGEPTLKPDIMRYIIKQIKERDIPVFSFMIHTNGLIYSDDIVDIIKQYSLWVRSTHLEWYEDATDWANRVYIFVSIDRYHKHRETVLKNLKKYQSSLTGYATVLPDLQGDSPCNIGRAKQLKLHQKPDKTFYYELFKRVELVDKTHKPMCPQFKTYQLVHPDEKLICCGIAVDCNGKLYHEGLSNMEWWVYDEVDPFICKSGDNIYEAILKYNVGREDCFAVIRRQVEDEKKEKPNSLLHELLHVITHRHWYNNLIQNSKRIYAPEGAVNYIHPDYPDMIEQQRSEADKRDYSM